MEVWRNSQRLANRCNYFNSRKEIASNVQTKVTSQFTRESICQMPWKEMPRNSGTKTKDGQCSFRPGHSTTDHQIFTLKQIFEKSWEYVDLEKAYDRVSRDKFEKFCGSMALMVSCFAPLSHSTAGRRFVFGWRASNQSRFMLALVSGKGAFCHLFFPWFIWIGATNVAKLMNVPQLGIAKSVVCCSLMNWFYFLPQNLASSMQ